MIWEACSHASQHICSPVYRDVCAIPPPTPTITAKRPTRPRRLAMAVAACCCGVPMSYWKTGGGVSTGIQLNRSRCSETSESGLSHSEQSSEDCQQLHARPLIDIDTSVHASAQASLFSSPSHSHVAAGLRRDMLNVSCSSTMLARIIGGCTARHTMGYMVAAVYNACCASQAHYVILSLLLKA
jgi:hypothetical protein